MTNAEFTAALGRAVNRPTPLMVPGFALRTALGEFAEEGLLGGQRAIPAALERAGFDFHHNTIGEALAYATAQTGGDDRVTARVALQAHERASIRSGGGARSTSAAGHRRLPGAWQLQRELADARPPAVPTRCCCSSTRRCTPRAGAPLPHERPIDGTPVVDTDRGGKITWHGPGQLVGYPIIGLAEPLDVVNFVRRLEESLIQVCAEPGPGDRPGRRPFRGVGASGRRRPGRKVAAIGVRVSRATTLHGFALNCDCDLARSAAIVPCGITDAGVTSLPANWAGTSAVDDVRAPVAEAVCDALDGGLPVADRVTSAL